MWDKQLELTVDKLLPCGAKILAAAGKAPSDEAPSPFICLRDLDGDGEAELAGAYRWVGETFFTVWKNGADGWYAVQTLSSRKAVICDLHTAPVTSSEKFDVIIGWQDDGEAALIQTRHDWPFVLTTREAGEAEPAALAVYEWTQRGLLNRAMPPLSYHKLEVADLESAAGVDGIAEIILWQQEEGGVYTADVYKWNGERLQQANDRFPSYFQQIAAQLREQAKERPEDASLWYQLASAEQKAGLPAQAVHSLATAVKLRPSSAGKWQSVIRLIRSELQTRAALYPAPVKTAEGTKWGYIDRNGRFIISPRFDYAEDFQNNGLAVVQANNHSGLINQLGIFVVGPIYQSIAPFSEGRAAVVDDRGFRVIDERGNMLTAMPYSYIGTYKEGRAVFTKVDAQGRSHYGYLDLSGTEIIPPVYMSANDFQDGRALVQVREGEFALIDRSGKALHSYQHPYVGPPGDGLLAFSETESGPKGYINESGEVVIPPQFSVALPFEAGRAIVNASRDFSENLYGLIDKTGAYVIKPEYNDINMLGAGRLAVGRAKDPSKPYIGSAYAITDTDGRFLTDFLYDQVAEYKEGVASATDGQRTFFIDRTGHVARNLPVVPGSGTLTLEGELVKAFVDQRISYYDRSGKLVWKQNTAIPLTGQYRVVEHKYAPNRDYLVYYPEIRGMANRQAQEAVNQRLRELSQIKPIDPNAQLDYNYFGDFAVAFFKNRLVELELTGYNYPFGAAHGMPTMTYVPIDLVSGRIYALKDLFKPGSDYVRVLSDIVGNQIKNNPEYSYVFPDSYKGIGPDQPFYVKENALYLYFAPYEIAPYAAGFPTFRIPFSQIADIIDENGEFWKSFH
ncbi:WG repeat-containing protein [Brevibacillus borstelensis]|uniref:WG repeat-containing protein n=1 Tax=Brevibacillus borstelensis TaxID=45462 RepID=UPI003CE7839C